MFVSADYHNSKDRKIVLFFQDCQHKCNYSFSSLKSPFPNSSKHLTHYRVITYHIVYCIVRSKSGNTQKFNSAASYNCFSVHLVKASLFCSSQPSSYGVNSSQVSFYLPLRSSLKLLVYFICFFRFFVRFEPRYIFIVSIGF